MLAFYLVKPLGRLDIGPVQQFVHGVVIEFFHRPFLIAEVIITARGDKEQHGKNAGEAANDGSKARRKREGHSPELDA